MNWDPKPHRLGRLAHGMVKSVPHLTETEAAWLACAIDAEGSIVWHPQGGRFRPFVVVYNTNRSFVERAAELSGGWVQQHNPGPQKPGAPRGSKAVYRSYVGGRWKLQKLLEQLLPHFVIKGSNAFALLQWLHATNTPSDAREMYRAYAHLIRPRGVKGRPRAKAPEVRADYRDRARLQEKRQREALQRDYDRKHPGLEKFGGAG